MSHELQGLSAEELAEHYYKDDPELKEALKILEKVNIMKKILLLLFMFFFLFYICFR